MSLSLCYVMHVCAACMYMYVIVYVCMTGYADDDRYVYSEDWPSIASCVVVPWKWWFIVWVMGKFPRIWVFSMMCLHECACVCACVCVYA